MTTPKFCFIMTGEVFGIYHYSRASELVKLPRYRCHKEVWALKIKEVLSGRADGEGPGCTLVFEDATYAPHSVDEAFAHKHNPQAGGYFVCYRDGYQSFSPAEAFEQGYTRVEEA